MNLKLILQEIEDLESSIKSYRGKQKTQAKVKELNFYLERRNKLLKKVKDYGQVGNAYLIMAKFKTPKGVSDQKFILVDIDPDDANDLFEWFRVILPDGVSLIEYSAIKCQLGPNFS